MTRKIAGIFLLLSGCVPLFFALFFRLQQHRIRHEMEERLQAHLLHSITILDNNVQWLEKGKEILVDGRMFDIKSYKYENNIYTFTGLFDNEETALVNRLKETQNDGSASNNKMMAQLFQWLQSVFHDLRHNDPAFKEKPDQESFLVASVPPDQFRVILTPPPQI